MTSFLAARGARSRVGAALKQRPMVTVLSLPLVVVLFVLLVLLVEKVVGASSVLFPALLLLGSVAVAGVGCTCLAVAFGGCS